MFLNVPSCPFMSLYVPLCPSMSLHSPCSLMSLHVPLCPFMSSHVPPGSLMSPHVPSCPPCPLMSLNVPSGSIVDHLNTICVVVDEIKTLQRCSSCNFTATSTVVAQFIIFFHFEENGHLMKCFPNQILWNEFKLGLQKNKSLQS